MKLIIYNLIDLQLYYDWKLANIGSIIEESVGRNYQVMKLFAKIMPRFKYYISTEYEISEQYYSGEENELAGIGQRNKFLGDMYRDILYIIIKQI